MIEVLKQMQEALRKYHYYTIDAGLPNQSMLNKGYAAYQAGLKAISELESQEPWCMKMNGCTAKCEDCPDKPPPTPQRTWVGLTDDEISALSKGHIVRSTYARAIEAKLKEKNT
jgi:hypothetical protein